MSNSSSFTVNNTTKYLDTYMIQLGDVDYSRSITSTDANYVLQYVAETRQFSAIQKYLADVNEDGVVNSMDALLIQQMIEE